MTTTKVIICPYCGETQPAGDACRSCRGLFEPLSRQATHNAMGPWYVHDETRPYQPGCSYETLAMLIERGQVTKYSIIRGPTTKQFWTVARHVPGVAHLLGYCHACDTPVDPDAHGCPECGVPFGAYLDRNYLGLPEVRPLPWEGPASGAAGGAGGDASRGLRWSTATAAPRGVSSFAADEEILEPGPGEAAAGEGNGASDDPPAWAGPPAVRTGEGPDLLSSPVVRSMQRRLARQQRLIRTLVILVVTVALVGALFNVLAVTALRPGGEAAGPIGGDETGAEATPGPPGAAASAAGLEDPADAAPPVEDRPEDAPEVLPPPAPAPEAEDPLEELLRTAQDATRPAADRIADYDRALAILHERLATVTEDDARSAIETRIARLEDAVERLRLKAFFR